MNDQWNWDQDQEQEECSGAPGYTHYQVQENRGEPPDVPGPSRREHEKSGRESFGRRLGRVVVLAVVFGLVSGGVFHGVGLASDRIFGKDEGSAGQLLTTDIIAEESSYGGDGLLADNLSLSDPSSETGTVALVAQAAMPAVVAITSVSIQEIPTFFGYRVREYPSTGSGSGIIVGENEEELLIATNNHVVEGADTLSVCFIGDDVSGAEEELQSYVSGEGDINVEDAVTAKIKGTDPENDLAVIAVNKSDIPESTMGRIKIVQLGSSQTLIVGEQVVAIGNALGYGQSVTSGWISALDRSVYTEDGLSTDLIQTDAAINPGNSGGALLNMRGELIGINSVKYASSSVEGMGYAIPISKAQPILEELMSRKTREKVSGSQAAYLGIELANLTQEATQMYNIPAGAFVIGTTKGDPAYEAGIRRGDIIVSFDGQKIASRKDLAEKLAYYAAGETVEFVIARPDDGEYVEQSLEVTLGSRPVS